MLHNDDGENFLMLLDGTKSVPWKFFLFYLLQNAGVDAKIFLARVEGWFFEGIDMDLTEVMLVHQDEAPNIYAHISKARPALRCAHVK